MKHRKSIRLFSVLLALALVLAVTPQLTLTAGAATAGICGENLTWSFDTDSGVLTISGFGDMYDFGDIYGYYPYDGQSAVSPIPWTSQTEQIEEVRLPDGLTSIGVNAFLNCANLRTVSMPESLTSIGDFAFFGCGLLRDVTVPDSVTRIGANVFTGCESLRSIVIPDGVTCVEHALFNRCSNLESVVIPDSVTRIGDYAFEGCKSLKSVALPDGVTAIGHSAFQDCEALQTVNIPDTVTSVGHRAFFCCGFSYDPDNWTQGLLYLEKWLISAEGEFVGVNIRPGTRGIAYGVFESVESLTSVTFPEGLEYIGAYAFRDCTRLRSVRIPGSVKRVGTMAFSNTAFSNDRGNWTDQLLYVDGWLLAADWPAVEVNVRQGTRGIADSAFVWCEALKYAVIPESVRTIGSSAFEDCYSLRNVLVLSEDCTIYDDYDYGSVFGEPWSVHVIGPPLSTSEAYARRFGYWFEYAEDAAFIDVAGDDYYALPVQWAAEQGVTTGTVPYFFSPDSTCTRAQVATFLWRAAGSPEPSTARNPFTDVAEGQYYYKAVLWAVEQGITTGTAADRFSPDSACTRSQVVTFLWRARGKPAPESTKNPFVDVGANQYYYQAVLWAVENGVTNGSGPFRFSPASICTRAQIVTFLYRAYVAPAEQIPVRGNLVGISMPTRDLQRWHQDGMSMMRELEAAGYDVDLQFAANDPYMQISQMENMIANGARVLIVSAIDYDALDTVLEQAGQAGCAVIAYDRPIHSNAVSCYITFDNFAVGVAQGRFIEERLNLKNAGSKVYNLEIVCGDPGSADAYVYYSGAMSVLQRYIDAGTLKVVSGQAAFEAVATEGWAPDLAQARFEDLLARYYSNRPLHAILASNDSTAQGVTAALENAYRNSVYPIVTGQDCDIVSVWNILRDKQAMSVFKDTRVLTAKTVEVTDAIMQGIAPSIDGMYTTYDGVCTYPLICCGPTVCTKETVQSLLIDTGYYTREELGL